MKKIVRIFTSGWIFLLAMAVLIIDGRTKSEAMLWIGTVLLLLGAAANIRDCLRRLRALRYKVRQRPGMENAGFWRAIREETKAARTAAETARTAGIPDPETAPEETEITAQTEAPQTTARETATSQMQDNAASPEESETEGTAKG